MSPLMLPKSSPKINILDGSKNIETSKLLVLSNTNNL